MWLVYAILTFLFWGIADLFYKKSNNNKDQYSHLKTGIIVGIVMGIHATFYLILNNCNISIIELIKYLPVSLCYILSMIIGYKGLKYIELSISSPIQNSSGIITSILLCIIFKIDLSLLEKIGILIVFVGILFLSITEFKKDGINKKDLIKNLKIQIIFFPIIYCIIDGLGTFLDSIYLDQLKIVSENTALLAYEYTFLIYGIVLYLYLKFIKKENIHILKETNKIKAAVFETLGQFTYVFAIISHSVITIPIVSCYSALSVLLSRIFLKEKLNIFYYIGIIIIFME